MSNSRFQEPQRGQGLFSVPRPAAILCCLFFLCAALMAQGTADIIGTVKDNSGSVVPNAKVTVKNTGTNLTRVQQTTGAGEYSFTLLPVGDYTITVEVKGFKTTEERQSIATGDRARVDLALQVGEVTQTVEVAEQAVALQTDSSTVGGLVTNRAVQDLPVNGRNFIRLVQLAPGATESVQSSLGAGNRPDDRRQTSSVSANGQNDSANNFLLDGMDNNERAIATIIVKPSIDAEQEVRVDTNLYPAETGRAGGAVINIITKSGSNNFHGSLFEFLRNDLFDAKNFFNTAAKPEYRQNQFGGSVGGPIIKDKTFFFADYEGFRKIQGQTFNSTIPSACELGRVACGGVQQIGNFSDNPAIISDPHTHVAYPGNIIPIGSINAAGADYAALFPTMLGCAPTCQYISNPLQTQYAHTGDVRIDQRFSDNDNLFARYSINNTDTLSPGAFPAATVAGVTVPSPGAFNMSTFPGAAYQRQQSIAFSETHIFSPTLLLQLNAQLARYVTASTSANAGVNAAAAFGMTNINVPTVPNTGGLPLLQFQNGGYAALGTGFALPTEYWDTNYQYTAAMTWTKGSHTIKFGANLLRRDWSTFQHLFLANYNFNATQTANAGVGGNAVASLLTGSYNSTNRTLSLIAPQYRDWEIGEYIQDNWHVSSKLTLNLGLRYDIYTPFTEKHNDIANFDPTNPAILASGMIQVAGASGVSNSVNIGTQWADLQPRIGFAWTLGHGTVLRGGFGTSYWPNNVASPASLKNAPFVSTYTINQPALSATQAGGTLLTPAPLAVANSVCLAAACGANTSSPGYTPSGFAVSAGTQIPYHNTTIFMTNLTLEKEFAGNVLSVGFVAEPVTHLGRVIPNIATNLPVNGPGGCNVTMGLGLTSAPGLGSPCLPYASTLPLVGTIQLLETNGVANYTALQIQFQRRLSRGLTFASNYTHAQDLSDVGGTGGACTGCGQVLNNLSRDYGPSDYMVKDRFTFTGNYELPFGKGLKGLAGGVAKGWQFNGVYSFATGQTFTVLSGANTQGSFGVTSDRPSIQAGSGFTQSINEWIDVTQFVKQPFGTVGNEGHNDFTMPHNMRVDLSVFKDFRIKEGMTLQFRAEGFNVGNTPSFGMPNTTATFNSSGVGTQTGSTFGKITSMNAFYTPRDIQFALKLLF